jgi:hypothetical protein
MPRFEIRCETERFLTVEADDLASAREIAEHTGGVGDEVPAVDHPD